MNILYVLYWLTASLPHGYRAEAFHNLIKVTHAGSTKAAYLAPDSTDTNTLEMAVLDEPAGAAVATIAKGIQMRFWSPCDPTGEHVAAGIAQYI